MVLLGDGSTKRVMVALLQRYSNLSYQAERLRALLEIVPAGSQTVNTRLQKQTSRQLRAGETAELARAYESGASLKELASRYGIHKHTVSNILERQGVPRRYLRLTGNALNEAVKVYEAGSSLSELSRELGLPVTTIRLALMRAGVTLRKRPGWKY
jgi:lambda repressor-like predicted transcriptional regulator